MQISPSISSGSISPKTKYDGISPKVLTSQGTTTGNRAWDDGSLWDTGNWDGSGSIGVPTMQTTNIYPKNSAAQVKPIWRAQ